MIIDLKADTWYYRLAENAGYSSNSEHNICAFTRSLLVGLIVSAFVILLGCAVIAVISVFLFNMVANPMAFIGLTGWGGAVVIGTYYLLSQFYARYTARRRARRFEPAAEPGFLTEAWRAWKGKYCAKLRIIESDGSVRLTHDEYNAQRAAEFHQYERGDAIIDEMIASLDDAGCAVLAEVLTDDDAEHFSKTTQELRNELDDAFEDNNHVEIVSRLRLLTAHVQSRERE